MPEPLNHVISNALPIIATLSFIVFALILLLRLILSIWLYFAVKNYKALKQARQNKKTNKLKKSLPKNDEELFRKKEAELSIGKADSYQIISREEEKEVEFERPQIVDIVKPIGFWTSMVLGQKLTYLISSAKIMNNNDQKKGFWTSMVEAQARAAGRERGKGR